MNYTPSAHKLSNGITVLLDPMDIATTSMSVSIGVGARDEAPDEYGITHFLEHMLCKGTARFPSPRLIKDYIEDNGGGMNASTINESMRIYGRILSENFNVLVDLIADLLRNSLFDEKVLDNERTVILDEYRRSLDNHKSVFSYFARRNLFRDSGLAHYTLGTPENISMFTREQMISYMRNHFSATDIIIGISGKIEDSVAVLAQLESLFGWGPAFDVPDNSAATVHPMVAHNLKSGQKNVNMRLCFEHIWPPVLENRFRNKCVSRFKMALRRRLHDNVRNKNGLVYGLGIGGIGNEVISVNSIDTETAPANIEKVVAIVAKTCKEIMGPNPFQQSELDRLKMVVKFGDADWLESAGDRRDKLISFWRHHGLLYDFYDDVKMKDKITVTDVVENSRDYFKPEISIVTQGPEFSADLKKVWEDNFS